MTTEDKCISLKTAVTLVSYIVKYSFTMKMTNYIVKFAAGKFFCCCSTLLVIAERTSLVFAEWEHMGGPVPIFISTGNDLPFPPLKTHGKTRNTGWYACIIW